MHMIDFDSPIKNRLISSQMKEVYSETNEIILVTLRHISLRSLLTETQERLKEPKEKKIKRDILAEKIELAKEPISLNSEEIQLLKTCINEIQGATYVRQCDQLIEPTVEVA